MAIKDVLLALNSYPEPTPVAAITRAVEIAAALGAHLSAFTAQIEVASAGNALANAILDIPGMVAAERQKSAANVKDLLSRFEDIAARHKVAHDNVVESCPTSQIAAIVAGRAMMHDLTLVPVGEHVVVDRYIAESVVFGAGRPAIVFPQDRAEGAKPFALDVVAVAWDFSRPAARALADALPILSRAKTVRIVTVTREKTIQTRRSSADLAKNLAHHGVAPIIEEEDAAGRTIGQALADYTRAKGVDLLVMGAYAHSRMRDFVLGGATKTIVASPPLPVLLSH